MIFVAHSQMILLLPLAYQQITFFQWTDRNIQLCRWAEIKADQFSTSQGVSYHCLSTDQDKNLYQLHNQLALGLSLHSGIWLYFPMLDKTLPKGKTSQKALSPLTSEAAGAQLLPITSAVLRNLLHFLVLLHRQTERARPSPAAIFHSWAKTFISTSCALPKSSLNYCPPGPVPDNSPS